MRSSGACSVRCWAPSAPARRAQAQYRQALLRQVRLEQARLRQARPHRRPGRALAGHRRGDGWPRVRSASQGACGERASRWLQRPRCPAEDFRGHYQLRRRDGFERDEAGELVAMDPLEVRTSSAAVARARSLAATKEGAVVAIRLRANGGRLRLRAAQLSQKAKGCRAGPEQEWPEAANCDLGFDCYRSPTRPSCGVQWTLAIDPLSSWQACRRVARS